MQLDTIEAGFLGATGAGGKAGDRVMDLRFADLAGQREGAGATVEAEHLATGAALGGGDDLILEAVVLGLGAGMHQLGDDTATLLMHGVDHRTPAVLLRLVGQPRLVGVTLAEGFIGVDAFGDQQREVAPREIAIVIDHVEVHLAVILRAGSRHRCEHQAIAELKPGEGMGGEQCGGVCHLVRLPRKAFRCRIRS